MIPNVDERLASVVRALTDVVLPSLPPEAGLAMEQIHLSVGHLQIIRAQLDATPAFEADELADAIAIARALSGLTGGTATHAAMTALGGTIEASASAVTPADLRAARGSIHEAITTLIAAISQDGDSESRASLRRIIIEKERPRVLKDRQWAAPFGFDSVPA
jgi:hypothetical protein